MLALTCGFVAIPKHLFAQSDQFRPVGVPSGQIQPPEPGSPQSPAARAVSPLTIPATPLNGGVQVGQSFEGVDFRVSNCYCGPNCYWCSPPDTNAAVGNNFVVETVNRHIRVFDQPTGVELLDEPLSTLFGAETGADTYVVYDDNADRWYVSVFDTTSTGLFLAVSSDGNPLDSFYVYNLTNVGGFPDYPKPGFNRDAIFISYNDFGGGGAAATIASIDKAAALSGTLNYFVSHPSYQFRAMPPAQMHSDHSGGAEWFVSTDGTDRGGTTIRVTKLTNYLSNDPQFTYSSIPVTPYQYATKADQPGGSVTTFPNTTTTQVQYHKGRLVTAMASSTAADGFQYPKGLYYQIDVHGNGASKPRLIQQGVIDPGPGVAVQMPSVDEDKQGNLGFTWMESSNTEYVSMWVGNLYKNGRFSSQPVAPGGGPMAADRIGDYSTIVVDPSDGKTFWAANEYVGSDGTFPDGSFCSIVLQMCADIWRTQLTSFTAK
jgi:hypothetical protein